MAYDWSRQKRCSACCALNATNDGFECIHWYCNRCIKMSIRCQECRARRIYPSTCVVCGTDVMFKAYNCEHSHCDACIKKYVTCVVCDPKGHIYNYCGPGNRMREFVGRHPRPLTLAPPAVPSWGPPAPLITAPSAAPSAAPPAASPPTDPYAAIKDVAHRSVKEGERTPECSICMDNVADISYQCGHLFCPVCARKAVRCPNCATPVQHCFRVYFP